jgi:integrase/recombinase XerD
MIEFDCHVRDYLTMRRALGFKLRSEGQMLVQLAGYLERAGAQHLTTELALCWAQLPQNVAPISWAQRLGAARGFATYLKTIDPATEIPPRGLLPATAPRPTPYLWSPTDVTRLVQAAGQLQPPLRAATHEALFGLIAATGIRLGEALALSRGDVALIEGVLTIREAKFGHTRLVPLHPTVTDALAATCSIATGSAGNPSRTRSSSPPSERRSARVCITRSTNSPPTSGCAPRRSGPAFTIFGTVSRCAP